MNKAIRHSITLLTLTTCSFAGADWELIDDFESYSIGDYGFDQDLIYPGASNGAGGAMLIKSEEEGIGGRKAAWFYAWESGIGEYWHQIPLPESIEVNESGTVYFRMWQEKDSSSFQGWLVSLSRTEAGMAPDNVSPYSAQAALLRNTEYPARTSIEGWKGDGYTSTIPPFLPDAETWYEYWLVVDNTFEGDTATGGYQVYVRKPGEEFPNLLAWKDIGGHSSLLPFRDAERDSIKTLGFIQPIRYFFLWLIDDIYMTKGVCLSDPISGQSCESWCGYPVINGHADTGSWLGWVYVDSDPRVYSHLLDSWLYVPACPQAASAWVYLSK